MRFPSLNKIITPFWRWALFLVLLPILELSLLLYFFGSFFTLLSVFISGLAGMFIAQRVGLHYWVELNRQLDRGEIPTLPMLHSMLILSAALLMILPGLLTSLLGLFLLFPLTRTLVVSYLVLQFEAYRLHSQQGSAPHSPDVIDV